MIRIGDKEIFLSTTIFIPEDEKAILELNPVEGEKPLTLEIKFENDEPSEDKNEKKNASFMIAGDGDKGVLTFRNWLRTFGSSITKPVFFASTDSGEQISLLCDAVKLGETYKIEFQFMIGGNSND